MQRLWAAMTAIALLAMVAACKNEGTNQNETELRVLNAVVGAEALDVLIDDDVKRAGIALNATSTYGAVESGTRKLTIRSATSQATLVEKNISMSSGTFYTLLMYGQRGAIATALLNDDADAPASGKFKLRMVGLSADVGAIDVHFVTGALADSVASFSSFAYGAITDYAEITTGTYRAVFTVAGTRDVIFESPSTTFTEGAKMTLVVMPSASGRLANAILLSQGRDGTGTFLANPMARLKAVNAIADSAALNFKADGTTLLSNVPFTGASSYVSTVAGARTLQIESSSVPGSTIASSSRDIDPAADYSMVATGSVAMAELTVLKDDNSVPASGFAKLRFVHSYAGTLSVDVLLNFAGLASGIAYKSASAYYAVTPASGYTITFATQGGVSTLATLANVEILSGGIYTAYLVGSGETAQARLVRDR